MSGTIPDGPVAEGGKDPIEGDLHHPRRPIDLRPPLCRGGFGLVEAMVAVLLLAVVLGGVVQVFAVAQLSRRAAAEEVDRWITAQAVLEQLVAIESDTVMAGSSTVKGFPVTWNVAGSEPRTFLITVATKPGSVLQRTDTLVTRRR